MKKIGKKSFLFNMYPSDGEVIAMTAIVLSVLENKVKKKMQKKTLDEATVAKKASTCIA